MASDWSECPTLTDFQVIVIDVIVVSSVRVLMVIDNVTLLPRRHQDPGGGHVGPEGPVVLHNSRPDEID